jgi:hypothetical protein
VRDYGTSVLAIVAAIWLVLAGASVILGTAVLVLTYLGFGPAADAAAGSDSWALSRPFVLAFSVPTGLVGITMVLSAMGIWRHRWWAWIVGVILSILGGFVGLALLRTSQPTGMLGLVLLIAWCLCLLFLGLSASHFQRRRTRERR